MKHFKLCWLLLLLGGCTNAPIVAGAPDNDIKLQITVLPTSLTLADRNYRENEISNNRLFKDESFNIDNTTFSRYLFDGLEQRGYQVRLDGEIPDLQLKIFLSGKLTLQRPPASYAGIIPWFFLGPFWSLIPDRSCAVQLLGYHQLMGKDLPMSARYPHVVNINLLEHYWLSHLERTYMWQWSQLPNLFFWPTVLRGSDAEKIENELLPALAENYATQLDQWIRREQKNARASSFGR